MAEVGLLPFARTALQVTTAVLPPYRSRFSKHQFTQPQLLAMLCLMRYEDWTFRETDVRLREHRLALRLRGVPDYTTLYRFLKRLDEQKIDQALGEAARRLEVAGGHRRRARVAVDATGLAQGAVSTFFVRCSYHHTSQPLPWRHWLKWLTMWMSITRCCWPKQLAGDPGTTVLSCPPWWREPVKWRSIGVVLADAEFDSEHIHTYVRQQLRARSIIPAKRGKKTWRIHGVRAEMRRAFPRDHMPGVRWSKRSSRR